MVSNLFVAAATLTPPTAVATTATILFYFKYL